MQYKQLKKKQRSIAKFSSELLKINAHSGFTPSQFNYSVLFNADPDSVLHTILPQNYSTFILWTRTATAQKEPRALFNLAVRMMPGDNANTGVKADPKTAYIIFNYFDKYFSTTNFSFPEAKQMVASMIPYVKKYKADLKKSLGTKEISNLNNQTSSFDFKTLKP